MNQIVHVNVNNNNVKDKIGHGNKVLAHVNANYQLILVILHLLFTKKIVTALVKLNVLVIINLILIIVNVSVLIL
jgi:hypothetical protein